MSQGRRVLVAGTVIAAALLAPGMSAAPAGAAAGVVAQPPPLVPGYECDHTIVGHKTRGWGTGNCVTLLGAPASGPIHGQFWIASRTSGESWFLCEDRGPTNFPSGVAELPRRVSGFSCTSYRAQ